MPVTLDVSSEKQGNKGLICIISYLIIWPAQDTLSFEYQSLKIKYPYIV